METPVRTHSSRDADLRRTAARHVWHHSTQIAAYAERGPIVLERGKGCYLWDTEGKQYFDGTSIRGVTQIGHGREEMAEAITAQILKLEFAACLSGFSNEPVARLGEKLAAITPGDLATTFFTSSGTEAIEAAIKMARQFHLNTGSLGRRKILSRPGSYHGSTLGALAASGLSPAFKEPFGPMPEEFVVLPEHGRNASGAETVDPAELLEATILDEGPETVAAFIAEPLSPIQGWIEPDPGYWPAVRRICDTYGLLLIVDEIFTGFGRTGRLFALEHWGVAPDIMTFSKGVASGYVPLAGAIASPRVFEAFWGEPERAFRHFGTYSGHPVACAAALQNIAIFESEHLVERAATSAIHLRTLLEPLEEHPVVASVSCFGMCAAIRLALPASSVSLDVGVRLLDFLLARGVILRFEFDTLFLVPPLIASPEQLDELVGELRAGLDAVRSWFSVLS